MDRLTDVIAHAHEPHHLDRLSISDNADDLNEPAALKGCSKRLQ